MEPIPPLKSEKLNNMGRLMMLEVAKDRHDTRTTRKRHVNRHEPGRSAVDFNHIKTRVKNLAKSLGDLVINAHQQTLTCRSQDVHVPVTCPREYEFSCTSSPVAAHVTAKSKSKRHYPCSVYYYNHRQPNARPSRRVHHALLDGPRKSPLGLGYDGRVHHALLDGPRKSPLGLGYDGGENLQPLISYVNIDDDDRDYGDYEMGSCVDKAAEEFIDRFYKELRLQKIYFPS